MSKVRNQSYMLVVNNTTKSCSLCEFTTQSATAAKLHAKFVHKSMAPTKEDHICTECGKTFHTKELLKTHTRTKSHRKQINKKK